MPDDLTNRGPRDRARVNIHEAYEVAYWTRHFGVTEQQLRNAVSRVGVMVADIKRFLGR